METLTTLKNVCRVSLIKEPTNIPIHKVSSSRDIQEFARKIYKGTIGIYEDFYIALLNNSNQIIDFVHLSKGGLTATLVDVRILAKHVIESLSVGVILIHNHPSGTLQPSNADKVLTTKVIKALDFFDVKVLDHIILTENNYFSFADEGILQ